MKNPPGRIFWNWELTHQCNYRCSYCPTWNDGVETPRILEVAEWKEIWDRMFDLYHSCVVRFTGGEPSIYPGFTKIIGAVAQKHSIDITTNLSFDIDAFIADVESGNVAISASFHPEFNDVSAFVDKVVRLNRHGFIATICVVAYPPHLRNLKQYKTVIENAGIMFKFLPFTGEFRGVRYPQGYTDEEKALMKELGQTTRDEKGKELNTQWNEWNGEKRIGEEGVRSGKECLMGHAYAIIGTSGVVKRCCAPDAEVIGNIFEKEFRLLPQAAACNAGRCPCFKAMVIGGEGTWAKLWEGLPHKIYGHKEGRQ